MAYNALPEVERHNIRASTNLCPSPSLAAQHVIPNIPPHIYHLLVENDAAICAMGNGYLEGALTVFHAVCLQLEQQGQSIPDMSRMPTGLAAKLLDPERVQRKGIIPLHESQRTLVDELGRVKEGQYHLGRDSMLHLLTYVARTAKRAERRQYARFLREMESELSNAGAPPVENQDLPTAAADIRQHLRRRR